MFEPPTYYLSPEVNERLLKKYGRGGPSSTWTDRFYRLWDQLNDRIGEIGCKTTKRYPAFYVNPYVDKGLFCYVQFKKCGIVLGIDRKCQSKVSEVYKIAEWPKWNGSRNFIKLPLKENDLGIIDILEYCYDARKKSGGCE